MTEDKTDILIVGAGPVGLFAAFYAGMRNLSVRVIDSLPEPGGQPKALYPDKKIYDVPGFAKVTGAELTNALMAQLQRFAETTFLHLDEKVIDVQKTDTGFDVQTSKAQYQAGAIIIAAGNGSFKPRKIQVDGLETYEANHVSYHVANLNRFVGKNVAVLGGGDSAFDAANDLAEYADKVYLIHRRDRFRAHEYAVAQAQANEKIEILTPYVPKAFIGDGSRLTSIQLNKARSEDILDLPVDHVFMTYGFVSSLEDIKNWHLQIENESVVVNHNLQTNIDGIFAIGDIVTYPYKTKLIAVGFGEAPHVVNQVAHYLYPDRRVEPLHSTSMFDN
ncbi:NAD(P)/FAD-dependent oxidoreductase [Aerococcus agrisoli]|uniref:Ferredoxin--NADP reductase n=1 Tax=Aerococcus agrisoli TaxID=2487350 RepID=A0A3N4GEL5_9LACT|nr:NAD(P)/FAD-dependent oxidoreductase [Aerococcus agrisoli]RPA61249.1 NAD(P)/FAD-dependent oxidoreductase [Aerococcus agrisoli]